MKSHDQSCQVMTSHAKSCQVFREGQQVPIRSEIQQYDRQTNRQTDQPTWSGIELLRATNIQPENQPGLKKLSPVWISDTDR